MDGYDSQTSIFNLDYYLKVNSLMVEVDDFNDITYGIQGYSFGFPVFSIERESDSGSIYFVENQLFGSLICMLQAQSRKTTCECRSPNSSIGIRQYWKSH